MQDKDGQVHTSRAGIAEVFAPSYEALSYAEASNEQEYADPVSSLVGVSEIRATVEHEGLL